MGFVLVVVNILVSKFLLCVMYYVGCGKKIGLECRFLGFVFYRYVDEYYLFLRVVEGIKYDCVY